MFLIRHFHGAGVTRHDFECSWKELIEHINQDDKTPAPYRAQARLYVDFNSNVELRVTVDRAVRRGAEGDEWKSVGMRRFYNTNDADRFGFFGEAYRTFWGRNQVLTEPANGSTSHVRVLKPQNMEEAKTAVNNWIAQAVQKDRDSRQKLKLVVSN